MGGIYDCPQKRVQIFHVRLAWMETCFMRDQISEKYLRATRIMSHEAGCRKGSQPRCFEMKLGILTFPRTVSLPQRLINAMMAAGSYTPHEHFCPGVSLRSQPANRLKPRHRERERPIILFLPSLSHRGSRPIGGRFRLETAKLFHAQLSRSILFRRI